MADIVTCRPIIEEVFQMLVVEHNRLKITSAISLQPPAFRADLAGVSTQNMVRALEDCLPDELRSLEIRGACDQWITNEDVLIWAEHYTKFKNIYKKKSHVKRNGVGDMII